MKKAPYIYDLSNCIIYRTPHFTSEQAMIQASITLCKAYPQTMTLYGIWSYSLAEGKKRGNVIADTLPYWAKAMLKAEGFGDV